MPWRLLLLGVLAIVGASTADASPTPFLPARSQGLPVRTVAAVRGRVLGFAQDKRYLAWMLPGPGNGYGVGAVGLVVMQDRRTGVRTSLPAHPGGGGLACEDPQGLALVDDRAYWEQRCFTLSTLDAYLVTAAVGHRALSFPDQEEVYSPGPDRLLPPASDGRHVYFWSSSDPNFVGPIERLQGRAEHKVSGSISAPAALAAGGGRFARAINQRDDASSSSWSPDGKEVAYDRDTTTGWQIWLVKPDGTGQHLLVAHGADPDWSPDSRQIAYGGPGNTVMVVNADGSGRRVVATGSDPAWAPDGNRLAIVDRDGISIVGLDGRHRQLVVPKGTAPDWSPDGTQLVFAGHTSGVNDVTIANADGTGARKIASGGLCDPSPSWSPDGSEIAFTTDCANTVNIWEIKPDGTGEHALATGAEPDERSASAAAWGPAPGELVFGWTDNLRGDGDSHLVVWPGMRRITRASPPTIIVSSGDGRHVGRIEPRGSLLALAVSSHVAAAIVHEEAGGWALEIYQPRRRVIRLPAAPRDELTAAGMELAFQVGRSIDVIDARRGPPHRVATTGAPVIGLSIFAGSVAWAETAPHGSRIRTLDLR